MTDTEKEAIRVRLGVDEMIQDAIERGDEETVERLCAVYGIPSKSLSDSPNNYPQSGQNQQYRSKSVPFKGKSFPIGFLQDAFAVRLDRADITYLLMKESIDNNIPEIRKEVERSFSGEQPPPPQLPPMGIDLIIRESVKKLMDAKDENGDYIMTKMKQWIAVFWTVVGREIGIGDFQYGEFTSRFKDCGWESLRIPYRESNIANCTKGDFNNRVEKWKFTGSGTKQKNSFDRTKKVADEFDRILTSYGLVKPQKSTQK